MRKLAHLRQVAVGLGLPIVVAACGDRLEPNGPEGAPQRVIVAPPDVPPGPPPDAGKPVTISFVGGVGGNVPAGGTTTLQVQVTDKKGNPVAGREVTWTSDPEGSFNPTSAMTDGQGFAATDFTVATTAGTQHVITATTGTRSATGVVGVIAGPAFSLSKDFGETPPATVGEERTIGVLVTDAHGNGVPNHTVSWSIQGPGGSIVPETSTTDGDGVASAQWTLGEVAGQLNTARAEASTDGTLLSVDFHLTPVAGAPFKVEIIPSMAMIEGLGGNVTSFSARVLDEFDNELDEEDAPVEWSSSDPSVVTIDADGTATVAANVCQTTTITIFAATGNAIGQADLVVVAVSCGE